MFGKNFLCRKRQDDHRWGERVCHICKEYVLSDHLCYMQPEPPKKRNDKLIFYDFETDFPSGEHVVNFAVCQYSDGTEFVLKGYDGRFTWVSRQLHTMQKVLTRF